MLNFLIIGCAVSQVVTDQNGSNNGTGDIMGIIYDEGALFINPPFYLVLYNQKERFTKLVKEFSFSFDSIPTGSYSLILIDSLKSEGLINTDTLYHVSVGNDSISMVAMKFHDQNKQWFPKKVHRKDRSNTGSIEGRFNVEEYEKVTGCKFIPVKRNDPRPEDKGKYASIYIEDMNSFKSKNYTDSLGNFNLDSIPVGFYELLGSKANYCKGSPRLFSSFKVIGVIILPDRTSFVRISNLNPRDEFIEYHPDLQFIYNNTAKKTYKWNPQFKD